jgi:Glycosyl transferase family 2
VTSLGLALIARDEEAALPRLLASVEGAFDQVALADTGSTDGTVDAFEAWAAAEKDRQPGFVATVGRFEWCDDFAAARNFADGLLETDWLCWADADDVIVGADRLRGVVEGAPGRVEDVLFDHVIGTGHPSGTITAQRERLLRRSQVAPWVGRVHEVRSYAGMGGREGLYVPADTAHWVTDRPPSRESSLRRNADILRRWVEDEPSNPLPLRLLAAGEVLFGDAAAGLEAVEAYLRRFREPVMTPREARMAWWAYQELTEAAEFYVPPQERVAHQALLVTALDCLPDDFFNGSGEGLTGRVEVEPPPAPAERQTRQQRRAEARAKAKQLVAA